MSNKCILLFKVRKSADTSEYDEVLGLMDTGATISVISKNHQLLKGRYINRSHTKVKGLGENRVEVSGELVLQLMFGTDETIYDIPFLVIERDSPVLLALKVLIEAKLSIDHMGIYDANGIIIPGSSFDNIYVGSAHGFVVNALEENETRANSGSWVSSEFDMETVLDTVGCENKELEINDIVIGVKDETIENEIKGMIADFKLIRDKTKGILSVPNYVMVQKFTDEPIEVNQHRMSSDAELYLNEEVKKLVAQGVISECTEEGSYASMAVFLIKKRETGEWRTICDSRKSNLITVKMDQFVPNLERITANIGSGARYFSAVDVSKAFWSITIDENSRRYYRFRAPNGLLYEFHRMPMGGVNSPSAFQVFMSKLVGGINYKTAKVNLYLDDIIISSMNIEDHMIVLRKLLNVLARAKLTINKKCKFLMNEIHVFGYVINSEGRKPDPERIKDLSHLPKPITCGELQSLVCGLNFYRQNFGTDWAVVVSPLYGEVAKKRKIDKVNWTVELDRAYEKMIKRVSEMMLLANIDFSKDFVLSSDASTAGIGGVLHQVNENGKLCPVAVYSRKLSNPEKSYSINFLELRSIQQTLERFRDLINFKRVTIRTDSSWVYFTLRIAEFKTAGSRSMLIRMLIFISQFSYTIEHVSGKDESHMLCDILSRQHLKLKNESSYFMINKDPKKEPISIIYGVPEERVYAVGMESLKYDDTFYLKIRELQKLCKKLSKIKNTLKGSFKECKHNKSPICERAECTMYRLKSSLSEKYTLGTVKGVEMLMIKGTPVDMIMLPDANKHVILHEIHEKMHGSGKALRALMTELLIICNQVTETIVDVILSCEVCTRTKQSKSIASSVSKKVVPFGPFVDIGLDVASQGVGESARHVLVIVDNFSKHVYAYYMPKNDTLATKLCLSSYFSFFGIPCVLRSDNGSNFKSSGFAEFLNALNIEHRTISPRNSRANSTNESAIKRFQNNLLKVNLDPNCDINEFRLGINLSVLLCNMQGIGNNPPAFTLLFGKIPNVNYFSPIAKTSVRGASPSVRSFYNECMKKREEFFKELCEKGKTGIHTSANIKENDLVKIRNVKGSKYYGITGKWSDKTYRVISIKFNCCVLEPYIEELLQGERVKVTYLKVHSRFLKKVRKGRDMQNNKELRNEINSETDLDTEGDALIDKNDTGVNLEGKEGKVSESPNNSDETSGQRINKSESSGGEKLSKPHRKGELDKTGHPGHKYSLRNRNK